MYREEANILKEHLHDEYSVAKINEKIMNVVIGTEQTSESTAESSEPSVFMA
jgi:hypothetical protein